jgi:assimilatory nitrate reductase catalytic subunit
LQRLFPLRDSDDIFRELAAASKGGSADYSGMTYAKIEKNMGMFWPCPSFNHPEPAAL